MLRLNQDLNVEASEGAYLRVFTLSGAREPDPLLSTATTTSGRHAQYRHGPLSLPRSAQNG